MPNDVTAAKLKSAAAIHGRRRRHVQHQMFQTVRLLNAAITNVSQQHVRPDSNYHPAEHVLLRVQKAPQDAADCRSRRATAAYGRRLKPVQQPKNMHIRFAIILPDAVTHVIRGIVTTAPQTLV